MWSESREALGSGTGKPAPSRLGWWTPLPAPLDISHSAGRKGHQGGADVPRPCPCPSLDVLPHGSRVGWLRVARWPWPGPESFPLLIQIPDVGLPALWDAPLSAGQTTKASFSSKASLPFQLPSPNILLSTQQANKLGGGLLGQGIMT